MAAQLPAAVTNAVPVTVDGGPTGRSVNIPFVSVTVCRPGSSSQCQTIDHVLLDTGSTGLRLLSSVLSPTLGLSASSSSTGLPLLNCAQFLDNSFTWGPVVSADVSLGGNAVANLPIQRIGDPQYNTLSPACASGVANDTVAALGANGVLGLGLFQQDCGAGCAKVVNNGIYFTCASASCQKVVPIAVPQSQQLQNLAGALARDNNGVVIDLPNAAGAGARAVSGNLYLGIGTQSNNQLGSASVLTTDGNGFISTSFAGKILPTSFIDTGSNGLYFDAASIAPCTDARTFGFYCPAAASTLTAALVGANGARATVSFGVDNAASLLASTANSVLPFLAGPINNAQTFDWGLPFFLGRRVFIGLEGRTAGAVQGPFFAF